MSITLKGIYFLLFFAFALGSYSQSDNKDLHCAFEELNSTSEKEFLAFQKSISNYQQRNLNSDEVYVIPVVFHVIHNGEPIGEGTNIGNEKILEQLEQLNKDFRMQNGSEFEIPDIYNNIAADVRIEFALATINPDGDPTSGITRIMGAQESFVRTDDNLLKSYDYWPAEEYLNIWIADVSYIGWAQFPETNFVDGIPNTSKDRLSDGVVVDYAYVGENPDARNFHSYGRTLTHEVGHYLGLLHPWGASASCNTDDFCDDTPQTDDDSDGCNARISCGSPDMIENYMSYSDDECMSLFTICQRERMRIVLENAPRRRSLLTSPALESPLDLSKELAIGPNPATDGRISLTLYNEYPQTLRVLAVDLSGKVIIDQVLTEVYNETRVIETSFCGVAIVMVQGNGVQYMEKHIFN